MARSLRRGEVWTVAGAKDYAGKPRPCIIIQDDRFSDTSSITICAVSAVMDEKALFRIAVEPTQVNGLAYASSIMADKVTTVPRSKLGRHLGFLEPDDMERLNQAVFMFLGLASQTPVTQD